VKKKRKEVKKKRGIVDHKNKPWPRVRSELEKKEKRRLVNPQNQNYGKAARRGGSKRPTWSKREAKT